ncbi:peptidase C1 [Alicyclobacillus hesperidum subsp. aegles]|uniref:C1 family peptidase n=1 Tax=Alicyclobacillus hesperidum TaxID=89784 RepID=UPI002229D5C6|nr:C1 family peptidase [Alicyclobacillus hesperidum]GLG01585.1 peptidase C1 [Alicyclobacillus hesperidum subsp. aegles]
MTKHLYLATSTARYYQPHGGHIPVVIDLRKYFGPVYNQGDKGACSAFAATSWYASWRVKHGYTWQEYSEDAQYYEERVLEGTVMQDSGATIWDAVLVLAKKGVMPENKDPYTDEDFYRKPDDKDFIPGSQLPLELVRRLPHSRLVDYATDALGNGLPILFGATVFPELESDETARTGILTMPSEYEQPIGGHAMVAVGYDARREMILVRNSWGADWGIGGYFWMPFEYFANFVSEAYVIDDLAASKAA